MFTGSSDIEVEVRPMVFHSLKKLVPQAVAQLLSPYFFLDLTDFRD